MANNLAKELKFLVNKYGVRPSKGLGQNFLIDENALKKIVSAADIKPTDTVLEIGPGLGILTKELAKKAKKVIAVEKDEDMAGVLEKILFSDGIKNVMVVKQDILKINFQFPISNIQQKTKWQMPKSLEIGHSGIRNFIGNWELGIGNYKIVANLPYYVASPIIRKFLELENPPELMVLMVQKEVAQRICAKPPKMNLLAVSVQFYARPEIVSYVPKSSFLPRPKIDSAIIKIIPRCSAYSSALFREQFFRIVKAGFSQPRKQIVNNFLKIIPDKEKIKNWLAKNEIKPDWRAEKLKIEDWLKLALTLRDC